MRKIKAPKNFYNEAEIECVLNELSNFVLFLTCECTNTINNVGFQISHILCL